MPDQQLTVVGCGLIGGSICLALRRNRPNWKIVALDLAEHVPAIIDAGVAHEVASIDEAQTHLPASSLVILASPVQVILQQMSAIAPHLRDGTIVSDVGSTKAEIMGRAREVIPAGVHFIGGHPITGSERSGVAAADPLLFKERAYVLCPSTCTPADALLVLIDMVDDLLAVPVTLDPAEHDDVMAMVSHVPQVLAVALAHAAFGDDAAHGSLKFTAGRSFLDMTRIACSEYEVWKGILETNRQAISTALNRVEQSLATMRRSMEQGDLRVLWEEVGRSRRQMGWDRTPRMRKPDLRMLIDRCDEQIMEALGNRLRVVSQMGKLKKDAEASIQDPDRERRMMCERRKLAHSLDVPAELVDQLFAVILEYCRRMQHETLES